MHTEPKSGKAGTTVGGSEGAGGPEEERAEPFRVSSQGRTRGMLRVSDTT